MPPADNEKNLRVAAQSNLLITTAQAAAYTGYSRDHIGLLLRRGAIQGSKLGRDWIVDARSLLNYVSSEPRPGRKAD